jgi:hypothetical protein
MLRRNVRRKKFTDGIMEVKLYMEIVDIKDKRTFISPLPRWD